MYGVCYMMEKFDTKILNSVHAAHNQAQKEFYPPHSRFLQTKYCICTK